jgi:hypothetical protein
MPTISSPGAALQALDKLDDWKAHGLASTIRGLETQLKGLRSERDPLQRKFEAEIRGTLPGALDSLQLLVGHVARVDKSILFWHKKVATLHITLKVLKPIGSDRDAIDHHDQERRRDQTTGGPDERGVWPVQRHLPRLARQGARPPRAGQQLCAGGNRRRTERSPRCSP